MEPLYTRKQAAQMLGISITTLDTARKEGLISYIQYVPNGSVYFTSTGIQEYIARHTHKPKPKEIRATYRTPRKPSR